MCTNSVMYGWLKEKLPEFWPSVDRVRARARVRLGLVSNRGSEQYLLICTAPQSKYDSNVLNSNVSP